MDKIMYHGQNKLKYEYKKLKYGQIKLKYGQNNILWIEQIKVWT